MLDRNADRQVFLVGSSLGGNMAANVLPHYDDGRISAAVLVNPSLDLYKIYFNVIETMWGFYNKNFLMNFKLFMKENNSDQLLREEFEKKLEKGRFDKLWNNSQFFV